MDGWTDWISLEFQFVQWGFYLAFATISHSTSSEFALNQKELSKWWLNPSSGWRTFSFQIICHVDFCQSQKRISLFYHWGFVVELRQAGHAHHPSNKNPSQFSMCHSMSSSQVAGWSQSNQEQSRRSCHRASLWSCEINETKKLLNKEVSKPCKQQKQTGGLPPLTGPTESFLKSVSMVLSQPTSGFFFVHIFFWKLKRQHVQLWDVIRSPDNSLLGFIIWCLLHLPPEAKQQKRSKRVTSGMSILLHPSTKRLGFVGGWLKLRFLLGIIYLFFLKKSFS